MNKNIILQHYYYSRKKIISKRWCPGLIDERNIGKCLHSSSVGAHSLNLIVQYELIRLLKYWWVTSLKTLPWILCDVCVRSDVCELLKPVLELNLSTDGVSTLCADSKVKGFGPLQLRSRWFPRYFVTGLFFHFMPREGLPCNFWTLSSFTLDFMWLHEFHELQWPFQPL